MDNERGPRLRRLASNQLGGPLLSVRVDSLYRRDARQRDTYIARSIYLSLSIYIYISRDLGISLFRSGTERKVPASAVRLFGGEAGRLGF